MNWYLLWALGASGVIIVIACLVLLLLRERVRRHHRVDHKVATGAPLTWLVDPRSPARLHRRLSRIGTTADAIIGDHQPRRRIARRSEPTPLAEAATDLKARAVAVDRQLARVAPLAPSARRRPLAELAAQVAELESAASRLAALSAEALSPRTLAHDGDDDVRDHLDRLAEAQRELDALDADAGLRPATTNALSSALPPPPAPEQTASPPITSPSATSPATTSPPTTSPSATSPSTGSSHATTPSTGGHGTAQRR